MTDPGESPPEVWTEDAGSGQMRPVAKDGSGGLSIEDWLGKTLGEATLEAVLIEAPGAWLYRGRDASGRRALIHVVPLCPAGPDLPERLRIVAAATAQLGQDPEVKLEDHGYERELGPGGTLYWRLPWTGAAERLGQTEVGSESELVAAATSLLERLIARHARGRLDPLLHPHLIVPRTGGADLVGIPVALMPSWLAPELEAPPLAPEERTGEEARPPGDLWRLGEALHSLSQGVPRPDGFDAWLDRISDPDPGHRLSDANEALFELEALQGTLATDRHRFSTQAHALERPEKQTLIASDDANDDRTLTDVPIDGPRIDPAVKPRATGADEAPTMWLKREEVSRVRRGAGIESPVQDAPTQPPTAAPPAAADAQPMGPKGTVVGVRLADDVVAAGRAPPTRVFDDPAASPSGPPAPGPELAVGPAGTVANEPVPLKAFGPGGTVAGEVPDFARSTSGVGAPLVAFERAPRPVPDPSDETSLPPPPVPQPRRLALTVTALLLLAVVAAAVVQLLKPPKKDETVRGRSRTVATRTGRRLVTPWNDVLLETSPATASIIGERDGRELGPSPVRVLVPEGDDVTVLVTAPGYEPVRLVLPSRGRVTVHLTSTGNVLDCPIEVAAPGRRPLEVVGGGKGGPNGKYDIAGAVVMRSTEGHGAWLVRCATYGGQKRHRFISRSTGGPKTVEVQVRSPDKSQIRLVEGNAAARPIPATLEAPSGFVRLEGTLANGKKVQRWVPGFQDLAVELPRN